MVAEVVVDADDIEAELGVLESWASKVVGDPAGSYRIELSIDNFGLVSFCSGSTFASSCLGS